MRYSLLSRFTGGILGSMLPEILLKKNQPVSPYIQYSIEILDKLSQSARLTDLDLNNDNLVSSGEIALVTLPIALFYHESPSLLAKQLSSIKSSEIVEDLLIWNYALSLLLKEKVIKNQFFAQIKNAHKNATTPMIELIDLMETFLAQGKGLNQVVRELVQLHKPQQTAIALALYCFIHNLEDFRVCFERAAVTGYQNFITTSLTGALAGVYNSLSGIPISWRLSSVEHPLLKDIYSKSEKLFACWGGVYNSEKIKLSDSLSIASPLIIQPRASFFISSE